MKFVYPELLYALAAVAIPVIIHLFNFRKFKKIWFSNVQFLKDIEIQTKARNRLKNLLLLFCRILAFVFLILAFAQPFISEGDLNQKNQRIGIYIDNSFSMENTADNVSLLQTSVNIAKQIAGSFNISDELYLLTNDFENRHAQKLNAETFERFCNEIDISPSGKSIQDIMDRLATNAEHLDQIFLISDFQSGNFSEIEPSGDSNLAQLTIIPVQNNTVNNVYIDSCWFEFPIRLQDRIENIHIKLTNDGDEDRLNVPVILTLNGQVKSQATTNVPAKSSSELILSYDNASKGKYLGTISIEDFPVTFDDKFFFSYTLDSITKVLYIYGRESNPSIDILFSTDSSTEYIARRPEQVTPEDLTKNEMIILDGIGSMSSGLMNHLSSFTKGGGTVVYIPDNQTQMEDIQNINDMFGLSLNAIRDTGKVAIDQLNLESFLLRNVFSETPKNMNLPYVSISLQPLGSSTSPSEKIMTTINGYTFLSNYAIEEGHLYLFHGMIHKPASNFSQHSLFVPSIYNIALYAKMQSPSYSFIDESIWIGAGVSNNSNEVVHVRNESIDFIPRTKTQGNKLHLFLHDQIKKHGHFHVSSESEDLGVISLNYNRNESSMAYWPNDELAGYFNELGFQSIHTWEPDNLKSIDKSIASVLKKEYWSLCIIITLLFLLCESLIIRFWK